MNSGLIKPRPVAGIGPPLLPAEGRRVLVIHNPVAGWRRRSRLAAVLAELHRHGAEVEVRETRARGDAQAIASAIAPGRYDVVAVAGGDGTVNEAANGLGPGAPPLAVIPLGTANVLAHEIGLGTAPARVALTIARAQPAVVWPGVVNGRRFLLMAGAGYDAHVVAAVGPALKRRLGKGAYVWQTLALLRRFRFRPYVIDIDGIQTQAYSLIVARGRLYGGRHLCAPRAGLERPSFEACLFRRGGRLAVLRYGLALVTGRLPRHPDVEIVSACRVEVAGMPGEPVQGDGDVIARLPARFSIADRPLWLLHP